MKAYKLVEKGEPVANAITYKVVPRKKDECADVFIVEFFKDREDTLFWLSTKIKETKRGWTITAWLLTVKPIKIFLPRENFEKVEIEE